MKYQKYYGIALLGMVIFLHCGQIFRASAPTSEPTFVVVAKAVPKDPRSITFKLLHDILKENNVDNLETFQKVLDKPLPDILMMQTPDHQTLLDIAIKENKDNGFITALINKYLKNMIESKDSGNLYLNALRQYFTNLTIISYLCSLFLQDQAFMNVYKDHYWRKCINWEKETFTDVEKMGVIVIGLLFLGSKTESCDVSRINFFWPIFVNLSDKLDIPGVNRESMLEEKIFCDFTATLLGAFLKHSLDNKVSVEQIVSVFDCYVRGGTKLNKQVDNGYNLIFLVIESCSRDVEKTCILLQYFFDQGCDINEVLSMSDRSISSLLYFAVFLYADVDIILFLLKNGANLHEQLLKKIEIEWADGSGVDTTIGFVTPLMLLIQKYRVDELARIFEWIHNPYLFKSPFMVKYQKSDKDIDGNEIILYEEFTESSIYIVEALPDYKEKIKLLLKYGADINQISSSFKMYRCTLLMIVTKYANEDQVAFLLEQGADIFAPASDWNAQVILKLAMQDNKDNKEQLQKLKNIERMFNHEIERQEQEAIAKKILEEAEQRRQDLELLEINKEINEQRKAERLEAHRARVAKYHEEQRIAKEKMQERQALAKMMQQERKAEEPVQKESSPKAIPAVSMKVQSPNDLLKNYDWHALRIEEKDKIKNYLKHLSQGLHAVIPMELQAKYGFRADFLGKKNVEIDLSHILSIKIGIKNEALDFAGGHVCQGVKNLIQLPIIQSGAIERTDPVTQCQVFTLIPAALNAKSIIKTTFPESWSVENILDAIVNSEFVSSAKEEEGMEVVYAKTKTTPEIPLKLIFRKAVGSLPTKLITVIPILGFKLEPSPKKAVKQ